MPQYYSMTVKYIKRDYFATESELLIIMTNMLRVYKGELINYIFEKDSLNRNHLHGTFRARKGLRLNLFKQQYVHVHVVCIKTEEDYKNWQSYIMKDQYDVDQYPYTNSMTLFGGEDDYMFV